MKNRQLKRYKQRLIALILNPFFWALTITGNSIIVIGSLVLYNFESGHPRGPTDFLDALLWSVGIVTTVGYGDFEPQSLVGRITILLLMLLGTLFVWSYMAYLVTGLITPELTSLERDVHDVERKLKELRIEGGNP